mgnify:CR=1 FL=1
MYWDMNRMQECSYDEKMIGYDWYPISVAIDRLLCFMEKEIQNQSPVRFISGTMIQPDD